MNSPFTSEDRQRGYREMEKTLTPLVKALRRFSAGRPPENPPNTPLGAVMMLTEQRKRLETVLSAEKVRHPRITSMGVVIRIVPAVPGGLADTILVKDGKEGEAIQQLEEYRRVTKRDFVISGIVFAVEGSGEKRPFAYLIERTPEGKAALEWSWDRQLKRTPRKSMS
jgi:hypothetical protein